MHDYYQGLADLSSDENENSAVRPYSDYSYFEPLSGPSLLEGDPLLRDLIQAPAFKRLQAICFLGSVDYTTRRARPGFKRNLRYNRHQHSLGVARLASLYGLEKHLSLADQRLICAAALLHDVGHAPLSHSLEPAFRELFAIDHHIATALIIKGESPLGPHINEILKQYKVDVEKLLALISGAASDYDDFFGGPINFDTIEGVLRSLSYLRKHCRTLDVNRVVLAAMKRATAFDRDVVDGFWEAKHTVYSSIINSQLGVLSDYVCQKFFIINYKDININDYFSTEERMLKKLSGLRETLSSASLISDAASKADEKIYYTRRSFYIDHDFSFEQRSDRERYQQRRERAQLNPNLVASSCSIEVEQGVFDVI